MNKFYNTQEDFASQIKQFLLKVFPNMRKTQLKIIPYIVLGMILAESCVAHDIAKKLKGDFSFVQQNSVIKRIRRFFKNKLFNPYDFYNKIIAHVLKSYKKKHNDLRMHIIFDHMYSHDNYAVFMITLRMGKQGIPLWFKCFEGMTSEAYQIDIIKDGITYVSNLLGKDFDLIFLADRWFDSVAILKHIESLGHTYCIRTRRTCKVLVYDKKEGHKVWKWIDELQGYEWYSTTYKDILITEQEYKTNLVISKKRDVKDPWLIVTNGDPKRAIKDYGYRFGAIETGFKNQKSNGFYLESTINASLKYFESMYSILCFTQLFLTIYGADYSKNIICYKNEKIKTHEQHGKSKIRKISLFNIGLTLFNRAFNSSKKIRIPYHFILYDI